MTELVKFQHVTEEYTNANFLAMTYQIVVYLTEMIHNTYGKMPHKNKI